MSFGRKTMSFERRIMSFARNRFAKGPKRPARREAGAFRARCESLEARALLSTAPAPVHALAHAVAPRPAAEITPHIIPTEGGGGGGGRSSGEIVDVQQADQFQSNKTQFACGYFACAMAQSMARPDQPPTLTPAQVIANGLKYYREYDGSDDISNTRGMTDDQLWSLLHEIGLHYQQTFTDASVLKNWLRDGYPVIATVSEDSVHDVALGDHNPYPWNPSGLHMILLTGLSSQGNFLARDSANCTSLYDPNSLRPGPREYDAAQLNVVDATVVVPPWMPRPASATPPA